MAAANPKPVRQLMSIDVTRAVMDLFSNKPWYAPSSQVLVSEGQRLPRMRKDFGAQDFQAPPDGTDAPASWLFGTSGGERMGDGRYAGPSIVMGGAGWDYLGSDWVPQAGGAKNTLVGGAGIDKFWVNYDPDTGSFNSRILDATAGETVDIFVRSGGPLRPDEIAGAVARAKRDAGTAFGEGLQLIMSYTIAQSADGGRITTTHFDEFIRFYSSVIGVNIDTAEGDDSVQGTDSSDTISGGAGDDFIVGWLYEATAGDSLSGGAGNDTFDGSDWADTIDGGTGNDVIDGRGGGDIIRGGGGADTIYAYRGDFIADLGADDLLVVTEVGWRPQTSASVRYELRAEGSYRTLEGGSQDDLLNGTQYEDWSNIGVRLDGGAGNDTYVVDDARDDIVGLEAGDLIWVVSADKALRAKAINWGQQSGAVVQFEVYLEEAGPRTARGWRFDDVLMGSSLDDTMFGEGGNDIFAGDAGNDLLYGDDGHDDLEGGDGSDALHGGEGSDTLAGEAGNDALFGGDDEDLLVGGYGDDVLVGGSGADTLEGGAGNDVLQAGYTSTQPS